MQDLCLKLETNFGGHLPTDLNKALLYFTLCYIRHRVYNYLFLEGNIYKGLQGL